MAFRQSFPYTTFLDSSGEPVANGYVVISLPDDGNAPDGLICRGLLCQVDLDENGVMQSVPNVWPSSFLLNASWPEGISYSVESYDSDGQRVSTLTLAVFEGISSVTILGTTQTWNPTSGNAAYPFAGGPEGSYGSPPITILCAPGDSIVITATGTVSGGSSAGPDGVPYTGVVYPVDPVHGRFPSSNVPGATVDGPLWFSLLGAFADSSGTLVVPPFAVGSSSTLTVPSGASQLQLGINDNALADNSGSFTADIEIGV